MSEKEPVSCSRMGDVAYFRGIDSEFLKNYRMHGCEDTCLSIAASDGQLEVCKVLYERYPPHLYSVNSYENTIFHHLTFYKNTTTTLCEYFIHLLVEADKDLPVESEFRMKQWLQKKNTHGITALHRALQPDKSSLMIEYWIQVDRKHNLELLRFPDDGGNTVLHTAVESLKLKYVELLLTADPGAPYAKNGRGEVALWIAMRRALHLKKRLAAKLKKNSYTWLAEKSNDEDEDEDEDDDNDTDLEKLRNDSTIAAEIRRLILEKQPTQSTIPIGDMQWTALHQATDTCDEAAILDIVKYCPSCMDIEDAKGQTFLQLALFAGYGCLVMHVLEKNNIDVPRQLFNVTDQKRNTLMHVAVMQREFELVKWLMPGKCDIKYDPNTDEETPLLIAMSQVISRESNTEDIATSANMRKYLLQMNPSQSTMCTGVKKWSPLQYASHNGDISSLKDIIHFCPESMYTVDVEGRNFLHTAVLNGKFDLVCYALRMGKMMTTLLSQNDKYGKSPLGLTDDNKNTLFHLAVKQENIEVVKQLSDASFNISFDINNDGETPLMIAMQQARMPKNVISVEIRKLILEKHPNQSTFGTGNNKWTSLHHAASLGEISVVEDILRWCPNCAEIVDNEGRNFLHIAAEAKQHHVIQYVCDANVLPSSVLNQSDRYGYTPLHAAAKTGVRDMTLCLLYNKNVDKTTTNAGGQKVLDAINFDYDKERAGVYGVRDRMNDKELKDQSDFDLVVGALIATVSFTAGITVPGGYISDGPNSGLALLANHASFEVFAIANNLALVFSLYAVFSHFCTRHLLKREDIIYQLNVATLCTLAAIFSMMVAFIAGSYVVLIVSKRIAITVCVTSACFFIFAFRAIVRIVIQDKKSRLWKYCGFSSTRPSSLHLEDSRTTQEV